MTTSAAPTTEDLRDQLAAARDRTVEAKREVGAAAIDGSPADKQLKALDAAKADEQRLELAVEESKRRETETEAQAAIDARRQERVDLYRSVVDWLPHVDAYVKARIALDEAEDTLKANPPHPTVCALKGHSITWADNRVADLDKRAIGKLPSIPSKGSTIKMPDTERFTPEVIAELRARAVELATAEAEGRDIAVTPGEERDREARRRRIKIAERG